MKKLLFILFVLGALVCTSYTCRIKIFTDYDKKTDFSKYKTFAWIAPYDTAINMHRKDKPYGNYIVKICDQELFKKGMTLDTINPDVVFMFDTRLDETIEYKQSPETNVGIAVYAPAYYGQNYYGGPAFDPNGYNLGQPVPSQYPANASGYWGGYYYGAGVSVPVTGGKVTAHHVETGALIINMYDTKTRKYLWGGSANDDKMDITTDIPLLLQDVVRRIFHRLPIQGTK